MKAKNIFLIGTTGYVGGSLGVKFVNNGYQVAGLVRKEEDIEKVKQLGIKPIYTRLNENLSKRDVFQKADIVVNAADSDDAFLLSSILNALEGSGKMYIHTSGAGIVGDKAEGLYASTKRHSDIPEYPLIERLGRVALDREVILYSKKGIHTIVICPTMVYGRGKGIKKESAQIPALINAAKKNNRTVLIGKGVNLTSNVHIDDLTDLYLLAIEQAKSGSFFFAENGTVSFREIGEAISNFLGYKSSDIQQISIENAIDTWGAVMAHFGLGSNILTSSDNARKSLGWSPRYNSLLKEIETG